MLAVKKKIRSLLLARKDDSSGQSRLRGSFSLFLGQKKTIGRGEFSELFRIFNIARKMTNGKTTIKNLASFAVKNQIQL